MQEQPTVAVRGEAQDEVDAELATFTVSVLASDRDRPETLRRLTARLDTVRAVLDEYAEAIEKRSTSGLSIHPDIKRGEKISRYTGRASMSVTVADFAVLGQLMLRMAMVEQAVVDGPWWSLRPDSPVPREVRRAAIADALARAADYAAAVGARVTRLIQLSDIGMTHGGAMRAMSFQPGGTRDSDLPALNLEPARQQVFASVEARFEISEPTAIHT
jgi:uncharacterized protein YggE